MKYEEQYLSILKDIYENGYKEENKRTGIVTRRIPHAVISVDLAEEFPILKSKSVNWKTAAKEILWIMQKGSNNINDLDAHIWDAWADADGSIGKSYGYQIKKFDQVHRMLDALAKDPSDRRQVMTLWNEADKAEMNLVPCCHTTTWTVVNGKLNCLLDQRSSDFPLGVPFNTTQYAILTHMFAAHLRLEPGHLLHVMADAHIYENQIEGVETQLARYDLMLHPEKEADSMWSATIRDVIAAEPKLVCPPIAFDYIKVEDLVLTDYLNLGPIKFEVAV
jgi:thymidylate synthase